MSKFNTFDAFEHVQGTYKKYRLTDTLEWSIGKKNSGWVLDIPEGTTFDISVPRVLEFITNPHDARLLPCAAVHDVLLERGFDKAFASAEFRRAAKARGIGTTKAWMLFLSTLVWTAILS